MQLTKKLLHQIIDSNFKVWLLAGFAKEFETWQMSTRAVRNILWAESYFLDFVGIARNSLCDLKVLARTTIWRLRLSSVILQTDRIRYTFEELEYVLL